MQAVRGKYQKNLHRVGWIRDDAVEQLGEGENSRNTGPGVGARTAEIESADVLRDIVDLS